MIIGLPREIKDSEYRVGMVPGGVRMLVEEGHTILVEQGAGVGSGFSDQEYAAAGALMLQDPDELFRQAEMIVKVKEPVEAEYHRLRCGQILFTFLHLAPAPQLTRVLMERQVTAIAYETIEDDQRGLPLLTPMSEVAGRMSVQVGCHYLQKTQGGRGVLLGGVPGVRPSFVVVVGGGTVGINATKMAMGLGAHVCVLDVDVERLRYIDDLYFGEVDTLMSSRHNLAEVIARAELVVGGVLIHGASAPKVITRHMVSSMQPGSVIVDVAVDQGGCCESTRPTTHTQPVYTVEGVIHYCVANMPGAVPRTSTFALTNVTLPYLQQIALLGLRGAVEKAPWLKSGVNTYQGQITCKPVAESRNLPYRSLDDLL